MIVKFSIKRIPPVKHFENNCKEIWWLQKIKENLIQIIDALLSIFTFNDSILIMVSLLSPNPSAHQTLHGPQCNITAPTWSGSKVWMEKAPIQYFSSTWPAWTSSRPSLAPLQEVKAFNSPRWVIRVIRHHELLSPQVTMTFNRCMRICPHSTQVTIWDTFSWSKDQNLCSKP